MFQMISEAKQEAENDAREREEVRLYARVRDQKLKPQPRSLPQIIYIS